jgi:hydroxyethylthiazole kinase-like sugar kinase family protein
VCGCALGWVCCLFLQVERAKLEKAVEEELAAEAAADEQAKQQKREQIAAEERRLQELEQKRQAEVNKDWQAVV